MKGLAIIVFFGLCGLVYSKPGDTYTTKYDNVDLQSILKNDRLLRSYLDCLLGMRKCTKDGDVLKKHVPDALSNGCAKCNEVQKNGTKTIIHYLIKEKNDWWKELQAVYDPENTYVVKYAKELKQVSA